MELALSIGEPVRKPAGSPGRLSWPIQLDLLPFTPVSGVFQSQLSLNAKNGNNSESRSSIRGGFDVNQIPSDCDDGATVSSMSSRVINRKQYRENETERESSRCSDEEGGSTRKKLRLSKDQSSYLEESFKEHSTLNPKQKLALAKLLNLRPRQVEVWFQNRRARTKLKQTEVDCEHLKRCCESLTEENRRLQKELQEIKTLKASNPLCMQLPATTLTLCPSCERITAKENGEKNGGLGKPKPRFFPFLQQTSTAS